MKEIKVSAPGKLMLFGDHSVVYGNPCLVSAVDKRLYVTVKLAGTGNDLIIAPQVKESRFVEKALSFFKKKFSVNHSVEIRTEGDFSNRVGLGSSSAVTVATFMALARLFGIKISPRELFSLSYQVSLSIQGVGSGFDIAAAVFGGIVYFVGGGKEINPLHSRSLPLIVGYSGVKADTPTLIRRVAKNYRNDRPKVEAVFKDINQIVSRARKAIINFDLEKLGQLMTCNHHRLQSLGVSTGKLDAMVLAACKAGAYGAKLSGAGGGDCMIALSPRGKVDKIKRAIVKAGGTIINTKTNAQGAREDSLIDDEKELFIVVDAKDHFLEYQTRSACHHNKNLIHRVVNIAIFNDKNEVLLQKRSQNKDLYPGFYTLSASGHVSRGETYSQAAKRELKEELGINIPLRRVKKYLNKTTKESEMVVVFKGFYQGEFKIDKKEIETVGFYNREAVEKMQLKLTPGAIKSLQIIGFYENNRSSAR